MRLVVFLLGAVMLALPVQASESETYRIAGNYSIHIPPFFWRDSCTDEPMGYGWLLQQRLWRDLGVKGEPMHVSLVSTGGLGALYPQMKAGDVDAFQAMPATDNPFVKTTAEPFFNLENAVYLRQGSQWQYEDWYSLVGKRGAWVAPNGIDRRSDDFSAFSNNMLDIGMTGSYEEGFGGLHRGDYDYLITYRAIGSVILRSYGYKGINSSPIKGVAKPAYLAISKFSTLAERSDDIDKLLTEYRNSGLLSLLLRQSMELWLGRSACQTASP